MTDASLQALMGGWQRVHAQALLVGTRIDLRALARSDAPLAEPVVVAAGGLGIAILFRYGAVVFFNVQPVEQAAFLVSLKTVIGRLLDMPEREDAVVALDGGGEQHIDASGVIHLAAFDIDRLIIVADALAKSVVLGYDESRVKRVFDRIEPVAEQLQHSDGGVSGRQLLELLGDVLITQQRMVGRVEVTEKPELLWDHPELDRFYARLQKEYELPERHRALNRKLELISQTASTALGLLDVRRSLRVEWYIVILIVVEIILTLYQLFFLGGH
jgi:uncharacterized Rmd1/YagE family protein